MQRTCEEQAFAPELEKKSRIWPVDIHAEQLKDIATLHMTVIEQENGVGINLEVANKFSEVTKINKYGLCE